LRRYAARSIVAPINLEEDSMSSRLLALLLVIGLFGALTSVALMDVGYLGICEPHFQSWAGAQVFADLVIVCLLGCFWMVADGRARGINPWPFVVATVFFGSFGVLFYLVLREVRAGASRPVAA
jgi:hypothetical protein